MDCGDGDKRDVRRPMNAFLIFCKRHRSIVREKNPDLDNRSVTRILGDLWANLKEEEKSMYTDLAKQYKDAFMKANPDYKWHNPEKTVVPQKPPMPKPTNMKVLKNEIDFFSEGSIMPGKLADPSNMGGLSLLLIAGQQSDQQNLSSDSLNTDKETDTLNEVAKTLQKQNSTSSNGKSVEFRSKEEKENKMLPIKVSNRYPFNDTNITSKKCIDGENERNDVKNDPENENPSLLDLAEMCSNQMEDETNSEKEPAVKTSQSLLKEAILDVKPNERHIFRKETIHVDARPECNEKENISNQTVQDCKEQKEMEEEESAMITCGKLVVNHIIDKLYSSEIVTAARNLTKPVKRPVDNGATSIEIENNRPDNSGNIDNSGNNDMTKQVDNLLEVMKTGNKSVHYDEPDGLKDKQTLVKNNSDESSGVIEKAASDSESVVNKHVVQDNSTETTKRKYLLSETGSTEGEDTEESQPVRKSRRRNRGQRYQELINEGIIQPSKERMAALQQPNPKDEMAEEDFQSIDSYILPETAIRRIRKRTTSESAKDKLYPSDDAKRYKTGDFDLEAHIATLPACPVESMGRKRGFLRSRHCSETTHIRKQSSEDSQLLPVFDADKTVSLPPHVRLPSPQRNTEPVVGSRKRKARKHSITHLIPVPQSLLLNGKQNQPVSAWPANDHTCINSEKQLQFENCPSQEEKCESASEISDITVKTDLEFEDKMNLEQEQDKSEKCGNIKPKTGFGCEKEKQENSVVLIKDDVKDVGARDKKETLVSVGETVRHKHEVSKSESQGHTLLGSDSLGVCKDKHSVENCETVLKETLRLNLEAGFTDKVSFGKPSERSCKSLQEVDSNIPRGGSDVIPQSEVEEITNFKPKLQDSLEKKEPDSEIPETDLNFNSTVHSM